jgi:hypothetical protein
LRGPKVEFGRKDSIATLDQSLVVPTQRLGLLSTLNIVDLPPDDQLANFEISHLLKFPSFWSTVSGIPRSFYNPNRRFSVPLFNPALNQSEAICRYATLSFMAFQEKAPRDRLAHCLAQYRQAAQNCLETNALHDLTFASYIIAGFSLLGSESFDATFKRVKEFSRIAVIIIKEGSVGSEESVWIEILWQKLLLALYYEHQETILLNNGAMGLDLEGTFEQIEKIFKTSTLFLPNGANIERLPISMSTEIICLKVASLAIYLPFYFDYFLFEMNYKYCRDGLSNSLRSELRSILTRVCQLISHLPNIGDVKFHSYQFDNPSSPELVNE